MGIRKALCKLLGCTSSATTTPARTGPVLVGFYGDSLMAGTQEGAPAHLIEVPPVRRINELAAGAFYGISYARPGATSVLAVAGGYGMPFGRWAEHMAAAPDDWVVLRYGGADYVAGTPPDDLRANIAAMVSQARAVGKHPVLVGVPNLLPGVLGIDGLMRELAQVLVVPFIELAHIPVDASEQPDGVHPSQALSDRIAAEMVRQLLPLVVEGGA